MTAYAPLDEAHQRGLELLHARKFVEANDALGEVIARHPESPAALNDRAIAAFYSGQVQEAYRCIKAALDADADYVQAHINQYFWELSDGFAAHIPRIAHGARSADDPVVSIIMPTFNRADDIRESIASVQAQTFSGWELLIMNDGGSHDVEKVLAALPDVRIRYHYMPHGGRGYVRNEGLKRARGEFIAYLDDDDIFLPRHLDVCVEKLRATNAPVVFTDVQRVRQRRAGNQWETYETEIISAPDVSADGLLHRNYTPVLSVVHRRECVERIGGFVEAYRSEDWEFWLRMARAYPQFVHIPDVTAEFRWRGGKRRVARTAADSIVFSEHLILWRYGGMFLTSEWPCEPGAQLRAGDGEAVLRGMRRLWRRHRELLEVHDLREWRSARRAYGPVVKLGQDMLAWGDAARARAAFDVARAIAPAEPKLYLYALRAWAADVFGAQDEH